MADPNRDVEYQFELELQLQTTISGFQTAREGYWNKRLETEDWSDTSQLRTNQLRADADQIAGSIRRRAFALQNIGDQSDINSIYQTYQEAIERENDYLDALKELVRQKLPPGKAEALLNSLQSEPPTEQALDPSEESERPLHLVWERLCIDDAWDVVLGIGARVHRIFELERLVRDVLGRNDAPKLCVEFLALVSRSYVYGFVPECVVLCRSAMEAAFRETVEDHHCQQVTSKKPNHQYGLDVRIQAAFMPANNLLSDEQLLRAAREVKDRGDKVVHGYEKEATKDVLGTIRSALVVIDALARLHRRRG